MKKLKMLLVKIWEFLKSFNTLKGYVSLFIAFTILYGWAIALIIVGTVQGNGYLIATGTGVIVFWAGPFTPFFVILVAFAKFIQKAILKDKKNENKENN